MIVRMLQINGEVQYLNLENIIIFIKLNRPFICIHIRYFPLTFFHL